VRTNTPEPSNTFTSTNDDRDMQNRVATVSSNPSPSGENHDPSTGVNGAYVHANTTGFDTVTGTGNDNQ
jgi:hypothetical protein